MVQHRTLLHSSVAMDHSWARLYYFIAGMGSSVAGGQRRHRPRSSLSDDDGAALRPRFVRTIVCKFFGGFYEHP